MYGSQRGHDLAMDGPERRRRAPRAVRAGVLAAVIALLASGCGMLGLEDGPADVTVTTSAAAAAAAVGAPSTPGAITVPTLATGTTAPAATPTPWQSLTTTATPTTTEVQITAPTITRTVTFLTPTSATKPTIAPPTQVRTPAPACYTKGTCSAVSSAQAVGGTVHVVIPPGGNLAVAVLQPTSGEATSVALPGINGPRVSCSGAYCLVQGSTYGLFFGNLILVKDGILRPVTGSVSSNSALTLLPTSPPVVAGTYRFDSYGVMLDDSPVAARTWSIVGGKLASTGCGEPYLYATPPTATSAQSGPCTGTPRIHGYGPSSGNKITSLSGFVTPSGNIQCALLPGDSLACTAKQNTIKVATCTLAETDVPKELRGLRVRVGRTGGPTVDDCLGYTLFGSPQTKISYNRLAVARGFVCEVLQDGVTCTSPSGRGFSLNRSSLTKF